VDLSIIIVNWNSAAFLRCCLETIYQKPRPFQFEVIVIDNGSFDGARDLVENEFRDVKFVESAANVGFGSANNAAFEYSSGRNILFLNPDTEILGTALEAMVSALDSTPACGVVGCKLLNSDGSIQTSCVQSLPTVWNQLLDAEFLRSLFPHARMWGTAPLWRDGTTPVDVDVISGACLMIRRTVFEQVGRYSTRYFMYAEDADLCYKVKQADWTVKYIGAVQVVHHGGRSSGVAETRFSAVMMKQSLYEFIRSTQGRYQGALYRVSMAVAASIRLFLLGAAFVLTVGLLQSQAIYNAARKWFDVLRWALGLEGWAKQPVQRDTRSISCDRAAL
jgi:N-acetylglucosaminyl-diphospho-decaprenol L-rhamnosyltransferase